MYNSLKYGVWNACFIGAVLVLAILDLAAWQFGVGFLKGPLSGLTSMNPATALCFVFVSISFLLLFVRQSKSTRLLGSALALLVLLIGLYKLSGIIFDLPVQVDRILFSKEIERETVGNASNWMSLNTAANFVILGPVLLLLHFGNPKKQLLVQSVALLVAMASLFSIMGYAYQVQEFYGVLTYIRPGLHTAVCFFFFSIAILLSHGDQGLMQPLTSPYLGGRMARVLLPASILIPIVLGYLRLWAYWKAIFSVEFGVALLVISIVIIFISIIWFNAGLLNKRDGQRKEAVDELTHSNTELKNANDELAALGEEQATLNEELQATVDQLTLANETIQEQADVILRQRDEQLNRVLDSIQDIVWSFDLTGKGENYLSRSAEIIYKEPHAELIRKPQFWTEYIHPEDKGIKEASQKELEEKGRTECMYRIVDREGTTHWIYDRIRLLKNERGEPVRMEGIASEFTHVKKAEEELNRERHLLRTLIDNLPDYIYVKDRQSRHLINNRANVELLGAASEAETFGKSLLDFVPSDQAREYLEDDRTVLDSGQPFFNKEEKITIQSGQQRWLLTTKVPLRDEQNHVIGLVGISRDITEKKLAEEKRDEERQLLRTVIDNLPDNIFAKDKDSKYTISNQAHDKVMGAFSTKEVIGKTAVEIMGQPGLNFDGDDHYVLTSGKSLTRRDEPFISPSGETRWYHTTKIPLRNKNSEVIGLVGISRDITDQKSTELKIRTALEKFEILSKATNDAIWDWSLESDSKIWNHAMKTVFGYKEPEIRSTGQWWMQNIHPEDFHRVQQEIQDTIQHYETNWASTYRYQCANGTYKYVFDRGYVIYEDDKPSRMLGAMQDIDERMKSLEEVKKLSMVASKTDNMVLITDRENRIEWVNESFTRLMGFTLGEAIGKKESQFLQGPETDIATRQRIDLKMQRGESALEEIVNYSKAGRKYWIRGNTTPIFNESGELDKFILIQSDITQQKESDENIVFIARELANLIEDANTPIFGIDGKGYINEWNTVTAKITGFGKNEVVRKKLLKGFVDPGRWLLVETEMQKAFQGTFVKNFELPVKTKTGKEITLLLNATPRRNSAQEIIGLLLVGQDITELIEYRHNLEEKVEARTSELHKALQKEKELVELKNKFVSMVSHEFRTPLSSISLASGFIRRYRSKISIKEMETKLENIEKHVDHMTFLLEDILTIGKSDAGRIQAQFSVLPVKALFTTLVREAEQAYGGTHTVKLKFGTNLDQIESDEKLLRNIVINLVTNAIKFSPERKTVHVDLSRWKDNLRMQVKDHGMGIAAQDMDTIFTAFSRGGNVGTVRGTGLGLSIVKRTVELLKGDIQVTSQIGEGTLFTVTLPLHREKEKING